MINLMNSLNGNEDNIPCPSCAELASIKEIIEGYSTFDNESPSITIDLLVSEVKMWRSKETYERKLKSTLISSTIKKMAAGGLQIDGNPNN
jgi:hypothetical protein